MLKVNKPINLKVQVVYILLFYRPGVSLHVHTFTEILARHFFVCCRSGNHRVNKDQRKTNKVRTHQKESRKINSTCVSRMYVDEHEDGHVSVTYISAHTHELGPQELKHMPLPGSTKEDVAVKLTLGVPPVRILEGTHAYICTCTLQPVGTYT